MQLQEGQIYAGTLSISGGDGPFRRWIVVAPFGKTHIHSIDDPLDLHCWPASLIEPGIESGRLRYVDTVADHPALRVQRLKETLGVRDTHLSIDERQLERLLDALRATVNAGQDTAPYLAGEILGAVARSAPLLERDTVITDTVHAILAGRERITPPGSTDQPAGMPGRPAG